jgi:hypothetical protein
MKLMAVERQAPDVLAMVLADQILQDFTTKKLFIQGTYSVIFGVDFPVVFPAITVYIAVTSGHGETELEMRLVDVDEEREPIFSSKAKVNFLDPLTVLETVFTHGPVSFPEPGEYRVQLLGAGQLIRERRLQVIPVPTPPT